MAVHDDLIDAIESIVVSAQAVGYAKPAATTAQASQNGPTAPPPSTVARASSAATAGKGAVPLPEPRPNIQPPPEPRNPPHFRYQHLRR